MKKYLGIINLPYGNKEYVKSFDRETKEITTTSSVNNAILLDEEDKSFVRYRHCCPLKIAKRSLK